MTEESTDIAVLEKERTLQAQPIMVSPQYVQQTKQSLTLLQSMVRETLKRDRDYGRFPGIQGDFLWDPGASLIISSFNCHAGKRRLLHFTDDSERISAIFEVPIINNITGVEVGSGVGGASTQETKHKYRWVKNPQEWGLDQEAMATLKSRVDDGKTKYRIQNQEHSELINTIIKMASKRAETDAAESLPGVGSALRELFSGKPATKQEPTTPPTNGGNWHKFWANAKAMGLSDTKVHELLGVGHIKDWLQQGHTLEDAIVILAQKFTALAAETMRRAKALEENRGQEPEPWPEEE